MLRWVLLAVLVVALTAAATVAVQFLPSGPDSDDPRFPRATGDQSGPTPVVVVDPEDLTWHFGTMPQYDKGSHEWMVENRGKGELKLHVKYKSCSCTLANMKDGENATIPPGGKEPVLLEWNTKEHTGHFGQRVEITTNDPERPELTFAVEGMVSPAIVVRPGRTVQFMGAARGEKNLEHVAILSPDRPNFVIKKVTSSRPDGLAATFQELTKEQAEALDIERGYAVDLRLTDAMPLGQFQEEVLVETDHPKQPQVKLNVVGRLSGAVDVMPDNLTFEVDGRRGRTMTVRLWVRGQAEASFDVVEAPKLLKVSVAPADDQTKAAGKEGGGRLYLLTVRIEPGTPAGKVTDPIILTTDVPQAPRIEIPVHVVIYNRG